ncbi:MAG: lysophospholipid acyltransferase family protein [Ferruginibacter sp.]
MYYILFPLFYLLSLLPLFILYRLSDLAFLIVYHLMGYRKKVVMENLSHAFPDKTVEERQRIARHFYRLFCDTFIETLKMISMTDRQLQKMVQFDIGIAIACAQKGKSVQFLAGHQFNWELANWLIARDMPIPFIGVYKRISNEAVNRIMFDMRSQKGTVLVGTHEFRNRMHQLLSTQHAIGLAADQNPGNPTQASWLQFMNRPAPFVTGPDKSARKTGMAVVFLNMIPEKRGRYVFTSSLITEDAAAMQPGELTVRYRDLLEASIRQYPANYLWSHRRWKHIYRDDCAKDWIDHRFPKPDRGSHTD